MRSGWINIPDGRREDGRRKSGIIGRIKGEKERRMKGDIISRSIIRLDDNQLVFVEGDNFQISEG